MPVTTELYLALLFETASYPVAQAGLEPSILLPQLSEELESQAGATGPMFRFCLSSSHTLHSMCSDNSRTIFLFLTSLKYFHILSLSGAIYVHKYY